MIPCAGCSTPSSDSLCPGCLGECMSDGVGWVAYVYLYYKCDEDNELC